MASRARDKHLKGGVRGGRGLARGAGLAARHSESPGEDSAARGHGTVRVLRAGAGGRRSHGLPGPRPGLRLTRRCEGESTRGRVLDQRRASSSGSVRSSRVTGGGALDFLTEKRS